MRLTRIYYDGDIETGETLQLTAGASHHLVRVMRRRCGTRVCVFNGRRGEFIATMLDEHPKRTTLSIDEFIDTDTESDLHITLLQSVSRPERMDLAVQKAVELGVQRIVPVLSSRGIKLDSGSADRKQQRWQQIAVSACEQSGRTGMPVIHRPASLHIAVAAASAELKLILIPGNANSLKQLQHRPGSTCILVGPEGGLAPDEISAAADSGFKPLRFGPRILRTETAGIAVVAACQLLWGDAG